MVDEKEQERIDLEFKACEELRKDGARGDVARTVSALANAGGGTLIYGLKEDCDHVAIEIDEGYNPKEVTKEWLEQVIYSRIQRNIEGIRINPVWIDEKKEKLIYVVYIPQSERAPHQTSNKKFYIRRNFTISEMEEYEIRDVLGRRTAPKVVLD
ncbi:MAG: AlbA family DNA-binding domain-containing protein, partial [Candidatus Thorarchaeota archaeon]